MDLANAIKPWSVTPKVWHYSCIVGCFYPQVRGHISCMWGLLTPGMIIAIGGSKPWSPGIGPKRPISLHIFHHAGLMPKDPANLMPTWGNK